MKKTYWLAYAATTILAVGYNNQACAENMDYGTLQEMFGEPVTTSATGVPQRASEVAANMTIITADEIRQSGSRQIPEIIGMYVPGIDVLQTGENSFDVGVRGYQQPFQPRLLVLLDGRQVFLDDYSRTIWSSIPVNIDDIRQIEVVKGASSALFGSNAAGGVVNIVTYSPIYDKNNVANTTVGTQQGFGGDATATTKLGEQSGIKLSVGGSSSEEFRSSSNANDAQDYNPGNRYTIEKSVSQITPNLQANTELSYSESWANPGQVAFETDSEASTTYSARGGLVWQSPVGLISNDNYINHTFSSVLGSDFASESTTQLIVSQLQDQFKIGKDDFFRAAIEYRNKTYSGTDADQVFPQAPSIEQNVYSVSGSWLRQFSDKLSWTNAVRFDHQDSTQTGTLFPDAFETDADYSHVINAVSANSGLVYKATDQDSFRATYGRGVQIPGLIQEGLTDTIVYPYAPNTYYDIEGNPQLKPTVVTNYELGYDRVVPDIFSTAKFSLYYETNQDVAGFDAGSFINPVGGNNYIVIQSVNVGSSQGLGGEFELKGSHDGFRWDGSYSYEHVIDTSGVEQYADYNGSAPQHHVRLLGGYTTGSWEFDGNAQYLSSTDMLRATSISSFSPFYTDGYTSFGGRIGYSVNSNIVVALSGTNITRGTTQESPYPAVERQVFLGLTGKF